tara:strand:- start:2690 stop:3481 length:792 start_codon:yes stop_codon:yes gene_type:complete
MSKSSMKGIITYVENKVGYIKLDNPNKLNAVNIEMWTNIGLILNDFKNNSDIRCLVLRGAGSDAFSAGADISEFNNNRSSKEEVKKYDKASKNSMKLLQGFSKPTIAVIDGYCIGGGLAIALSCDLRFASEKSTFAIPAAKLGLAYDYTGIKRLRDIVGPSNAKYIFYTAGQFNTEQALRMRLVEKIFKKDVFEEEIMKIINKICENAPLTISSAKMSIDAEENNEEEYNKCLQAEKECFDSKDYKEGRLAFAEKRKPNFKGH